MGVLAVSKKKFLTMAAAGGAATGYYAGGPMGVIVGALVGLLLAGISEKR